MEIPAVLKGYLYPSSRVSRCPRFHACTVTKKCQNYDMHNHQCVICESRTDTHVHDPDSVPLGGHLAEGEYYPDVQDQIQRLQRQLNTAFAHPDQKDQKFNSIDIAGKMSKERKIVEALKMFSDAGRLKMEERIMSALIDPEVARLLGRVE